MIQRIFDTENEKDMQDLWSILPDDTYRVRLEQIECFKTPRTVIDKGDGVWLTNEILAINWHDKTEITRPIQEATEQDIGKLCAFWDDLKDNSIYGILTAVRQHVSTLNIFQYQSNNADFYIHCRRLTKQEIEEIC